VVITPAAAAVRYGTLVDWSSFAYQTPLVCAAATSIVGVVTEFLGPCRKCFVDANPWAAPSRTRRSLTLALAGTLGLVEADFTARNHCPQTAGQTVIDHARRRLRVYKIIIVRAQSSNYL